MTAIIVACITGCFGIVSAVIAAQMTSKKVSAEVQQQLVVAQAVTDTKLEELTREVREHNNFAQRMPVVENEVKHLHEDIDTLKHYHE